MQRRGARQGAQPTGQAFVGGRARRGPVRPVELGRSGPLGGKSHVAQSRRSH
ncbi:hypothetical protein T261_07454 [Streptomyces lydicus]|nr:hypothetical protein T261_07454 [Streptomyces lydicus]